MTIKWLFWYLPLSLMFTSCAFNKHLWQELSSVLPSCSSHDIVWNDLPIDLTEVNSFSNRIIQRYTNYAEASGYIHFNDSIKAVYRWYRDRIHQDEKLLVWISKSKLQLFTFDKKDSCLLYTATGNDEQYAFSTTTLPVPRGRYILAYNNRESLVHIPEP